MGFEQDEKLIITPGEASLIEVPGRKEQAEQIAALAYVMEEVSHFVGATSILFLEELERRKICRNRKQLQVVQRAVLAKISKLVDERYGLKPTEGDDADKSGKA